MNIPLAKIRNTGGVRMCIYLVLHGLKFLVISSHEALFDLSSACFSSISSSVSSITVQFKQRTHSYKNTPTVLSCMILSSLRLLEKSNLFSQFSSKVISFTKFFTHLTTLGNILYLKFVCMSVFSKRHSF